MAGRARSGTHSLLRALLALQSLEAGKLIPFQVMHAIGRAFEPTDRNGPLGQVKIIPAQIACLAHAQPVAIDQKPDQPIALTMPVLFQRGEQLGHFAFG